jgi:hypothetical protein
LTELKKEICDQMRKNRNKIEAKNSRLKEKLQKKDYEEITKKI